MDTINSLNLIKVPKCYGGKTTFNVDLEEGPWCQMMSGLGFTKGNFTEETKET